MIVQVSHRLQLSGNKEKYMSKFAGILLMISGVTHVTQLFFYPLTSNLIGKVPRVGVIIKNEKI